MPRKPKAIVGPSLLRKPVTIKLPPAPLRNAPPCSEGWREHNWTAQRNHDTQGTEMLYACARCKLTATAIIGRQMGQDIVTYRKGGRLVHGTKIEKEKRC